MPSPRGSQNLIKPCKNEDNRLIRVSQLREVKADGMIDGWFD
jgi:hypothetical protein